MSKEGNDSTVQAADNDEVLDPAALVTVRDADWIDEPADMVYAVMDGFRAPLYDIARLGGDGHQWRNVPRENLMTVNPNELHRRLDAEGEPYYSLPTRQHSQPANTD